MAFFFFFDALGRVVAALGRSNVGWSTSPSRMRRAALETPPWDSHHAPHRVRGSERWRNIALRLACGCPHSSHEKEDRSRSTATVGGEHC